MPAQPPGRGYVGNAQESGSRPIRVVNLDDDDVPSFGGMEIIGWDSDRSAFKVQRCSVTGRNDLLFNGMTPIPSGMEGQARSDLHIVAGFNPDNGTNPRPGEVWGIPAGEWLLSPTYTGYTIVDTTTAVRGFCVITAQRANITEFLRVTGTPSAGGIPPEWVEGELVFFDPIADDWDTTDPTTPVYFRDLSGETGYYDADGNPCLAHVNRVGFAFGLPLYIGRANCSTTTGSGPTTTTTTTGSPCSGKCKWSFSFLTKTWSKDSMTCDTGCNCLAPTYCPPIGDPACTYTECSRMAADQVPADCTGSTTTPGPGDCSTTTSSACTAGCQYYCHPVRGWQQQSAGCAPSCPCAGPSGPCDGSNACSTVTTPCITSMPYCNGGCRWVWLHPGDAWELFSSDCRSSGVASCVCDPPSGAGSACGQETLTACYSPTGIPAGCGTPTTTTAGPGCSGTCLWGTSDGSTWDTVLRHCPSCDCSTPIGNPTDSCQQVETPCVEFPSSTTTTTTTTTTTLAPTTTTTESGTTTTPGPTTTTTTTTAAPCTICKFHCVNPTWVKTVDCLGENCFCPGPPDTPDPPSPIFYCWQCSCGFGGLPPCDSPFGPGIYRGCNTSPLAAGLPCAASAFALGGPYVCGPGQDCGACGVGVFDCPPSGVPCGAGNNGLFYNVSCVTSTTTTTTGSFITTADIPSTAAPE